MTNAEIIQAIRNEIERLEENILSKVHHYPIHRIELLDDLLAFLSTLESEKPVPNDLEEAADKYKKQVIEETKCHHNALTYAEGYEDALLLIPDAFIDGAKWQKEQMMEEAVEGVVCYGSKGAYIETDFLGEYDTDVYGNPGDKVRIIIVKE